MNKKIQEEFQERIAGIVLHFGRCCWSNSPHFLHTRHTCTEMTGDRKRRGRGCLEVERCVHIFKCFHSHESRFLALAHLCAHAHVYTHKHTHDAAACANRRVATEWYFTASVFMAGYFDPGWSPLKDFWGH